CSACLILLRLRSRLQLGDLLRCVLIDQFNLVLMDEERGRQLDQLLIATRDLLSLRPRLLPGGHRCSRLAWLTHQNTSSFTNSKTKFCEGTPLAHPTQKTR